MAGFRMTQEEYESYMAHHNSSAVQTSNVEPATSNEPLGKGKSTPLDTPVRIRCHTKGKRLGDCDGRSFKAALDAIVTGGILPTDSAKSVTQVSFTQEHSDEDQTIITIESVPL